MGITRITTWKTSDGEIHDRQEDALGHEAKVDIKKLVYNCTVDSEFDLDDFLRALREDGSLKVQFNYLIGN